MATDPLFDFETLLAPIPGDGPTGEDPREGTSSTAAYRDLRDARNAARSGERQLEGFEGEEESEAGVSRGEVAAHWRAVVEGGQAFIAESAKDLEVATWMTEGLVRTYGFPGLRDGFRLIRELVETYWEGLYPPEDEDGLEGKVAPVEGADSTLVQPIRMVPITAATSTSDPFTTWEYEQASALAQISDADVRERRIAAGAVTLEQIQNAVRATPPTFYQGLLDDLDGCLEEFNRMRDAFDERCGSYAPGTGGIRDILTTVQDTVKTLTRDVVLPETPGEAEAAAPAAESGAGAAAGAAAPAAARGAAVVVEGIATRDEAFRALLKVAEFFRKTEPHSPISYTLEEVVRRGRMPLQDLLAELIPDEEARNGFLMRAGIEPPSASSADEGY
jgi:type VI secretion system protein ImpA